MSQFGYFMMFVLGTALGSFLNVLAFRYNPDKNVLVTAGGRSHCMYCKKTLSWYELIPLLSFIVQLGRCRSCGHRLSFQYPLVELISALIFVAVPYALTPIGSASPIYLIAVWLAVFLALILISVIDLRTRIIPDELNIFIGLLAILNLIILSGEGAFGAMKDGLYRSFFGVHTHVTGSFLGMQSGILWITDIFWLNFIAGGVFGALFFGSIYFITRGRGMGFGDVKLAAAAGLLLGFPDMVLATMIAFITGAASGLFMISIGRKKGMKDTLPFGPFIALGITITVLFGYDIINAYFRFFDWFL